MQAPLHSMGTAIRPIERHGMEAVKWFLYDPNTGAIMGRTLKSWILIIIFYTIYYSCLAAFWLVCLIIFMSTTLNAPNIKEAKPRWTEASSRIGRSPALGYRPNQTYELIDSSMILYNKDSIKDEGEMPGWSKWKDRTEEFLKKYEDCYDHTLFCIDELEECGKNNFGFDVGSPCMFLKLNKIYGLIPEWYNDTDSVPNDVAKNKVFPQELKEHINELPRDKRNQVWVHCQGENAADRENIVNITYFPSDRGFPKIYFPYKNQKYYRSPLVAVKFEIELGILVHVECRAWAKNIGYDHMDRIGKAHFELIIYDETMAKRVKSKK